MTVLTAIDPADGGGRAITLDGGNITAIEPAEAPDGLMIAPGLVDLQVNGYAGIDLNDGALQPATVGRLARRLLETGVTCFFPTLVTADEESLLRGLAAIATAAREDALAARMIGGIHVEGPFISPEDGARGAHPRQHVRPPDLDEFARWQAAGEGRIRLVTLSPHWPEAPAFIAALAGQGVHVAIGHTHATPEQVHAAAGAGARLSTHLGNGAAAMLPRHPNFVWAQLADDRLSAGFIADGHHLPADTLKAMLRAKSLARSFLVSDSAAPGGMAPGVYDQHIGGRVELGADGRLSLAGTPYLAGAARSLNEDVAMAAKLTGLPLADVLGLATRNPGRFAGRNAALEIGAPADLMLFRHRPGDERLAIAEVWLAGERVVPCA